jgi:hypothetical protein
VVNFTINSIDVPGHPVTAEHSEALTSTHRNGRRVLSVIVTTYSGHVARPGTSSTRLQTKAVWGPRVH